MTANPKPMSYWVNEAGTVYKVLLIDDGDVYAMTKPNLGPGAMDWLSWCSTMQEFMQVFRPASKQAFT